MMKLSMLDSHVYEKFVKPDSSECVEVRILGAKGLTSAWDGYAKGTVVGYFDDFKRFSQTVVKLQKIDKTVQDLQIYMTLQVIDPSLLGRSYNQLTCAKITTSDKDVIFYRWLPLDLDPVRKSGISSSDEELEHARELSDEIARQLAGEGWPLPIRAMSGNGHHLLYRLNDLPAQDLQVRTMIKQLLSEFSVRFSNDKVHLDTTLYNQSRIIKLYGTTAHKGTPVPAGPHRIARPHRESYIFDLGEC